MINTIIILINLLMIVVTMFLGYILPFNLYKLKYKIGNRFYIPKLEILKIFCSIFFILIYFIILHYGRSLFINKFDFQKIKPYPVSFIMPLYIFPFLFLVWLTRAKYGNIKMIYNKSKPDKNELRNEIMSYSTESLILNGEAVLIGLCKYYLKHYGKSDDIIKAMNLVNEKQIKLIFTKKIIFSLSVLLIFIFVIKIHIIFAFFITYLITDTLFAKFRLFGNHTKAASKN